MLRIIGRKLTLLLVLLPLLNVVGFYYGAVLGPARMAERYGTSVNETATPSRFLPAYMAYLRHALAGNLGAVNDASVRSVVATPMTSSVVLLGIALALTLAVGPALGVLAIAPRTGQVRPVAHILLTVGAGVPGFFLGSLLIAALLVAARAGITNGRQPLLPVQGSGFDAHIVLPVLTLAVRPVLFVAGITAALLEGELRRDYVQVARSKGLRWRQLLWRHVLPNGMAAMIVAVGQSARMLVSTQILVEALFDWRGAARLFVQTVAIPSSGSTSPYFLNPALIALLLMFFGAVLLCADLIASVSAYAADPRLRLPLAVQTG